MWNIWVWIKLSVTIYHDDLYCTIVRTHAHYDATVTLLQCNRECLVHAYLHLCVHLNLNTFSGIKSDPIPLSLPDVFQRDVAPLTHGLEDATFTVQRCRSIEFGNFSLIHHQDTIVVDDRHQAMRDAQKRLVFEFTSDRFLDPRVGRKTKCRNSA